MKRTVLLLLLALFCLLAAACAPTDNGTYITFAENGVLTARQSTAEAGTVTLPSPVGTHGAFCVGWQAAKGEETLFLPVGSSYSYEAEEHLSFSPVYLHLTTLNAVEINVETIGLSFATTFQQTELNDLLTLDGTLTCGALILPLADAQMLESALTHAALASNGITANDIAATPDGEAGTFRALLTGITTEQLLTKFTAVGYARITYTNGDVRYAYATYENGQAPAAALLSFAPMQSTLALVTDSTPVLDPQTGAVHITTSIAADKWQLLSPNLFTLTCGTLLATAEELEQTGGVLTHAAMSAAGCVPTDVIANGWCQEEAEKLYFEGIFHTAPHARLQDYAAVGYIKITYPDGTSEYIYAMHKDEQTAYSLYDLASAAKNDLSDTQTDTHPYAAGEKFSPYTADEQARIQELATLPLLLLYDKTVPAKRRLAAEYLVYFDEHYVSFNNNAWNDETEEIWQAIADIEYWGGAALIITAKDGTPLTADALTGVITLQNGSVSVTVTKFICHNGMLIIPHTNFITPGK